MKFDAMPFAMQRSLERLNLSMAIYCPAVFFFGWVTSPRPAEDNAVHVILLLLALWLLPFLALTSVMLLFLDTRRGVPGLIAFLAATLLLVNTSRYLA